MFKNKASNGKNNICGEKIYTLRKGMKLSQRAFADKMQINGIDIDKNAIQRIESGERFVTDIELIVLSKVLNTDIKNLLLL